jgi:deoxyadenosine/deoxycytidine kinase
MALVIERMAGLLTKYKVIVLEGIIGAGKTTLFNYLVDYWTGIGLSVVGIKEPVELWKSTGILEAFYKDPKRMAYTFQTFVNITRIKAIKEAYNSRKNVDIYLLERSVYTDRYLFVDLLKDNGTMNNMEITLYEEWWDMWKHILPFIPSQFVYLDSDISTCMTRVKERNRGGEENISREYQVALKAKHDLLFRDNFVLIDGQKVQVLKLNIQEDFREDPQLLSSIARLIYDDRMHYSKFILRGEERAKYEKAAKEEKERKSKEELEDSLNLFIKKW